MTALPHREILSPQPQYLKQHRQRRHRKRSHRAITFEASLKIFVYSTLSFVSVATMLKLWPYQQAQMDKLQEIRLRVQETQARVNQLSQQLGSSFDARQGKKLMQEHSYRVDPNQRRIFLLDKPQSASQSPAVQQASVTPRP